MTMKVLKLDQLSPAAQGALERRAAQQGLSSEMLALQLLENELGRNTSSAAWGTFSMWLLQQYTAVQRSSCISEIEGERRKAALHLAIRAGLDPEEVFDEAYEELCYEAGLSPETVHSLMETAL